MIDRIEDIKDDIRYHIANAKANNKEAELFLDDLIFTVYEMRQKSGFNSSMVLSFSESEELFQNLMTIRSNYHESYTRLELALKGMDKLRKEEVKVDE